MCCSFSFQTAKSVARVLNKYTSTCNDTNGGRHVSSRDQLCPDLSPSHQLYTRTLPVRLISVGGWEPSTPGSRTPSSHSWWGSSSPSSSSSLRSVQSVSISTSNKPSGKARFDIPFNFYHKTMGGL